MPPRRPRNPRRPRPPSSTAGELRIIGGQWRGRKLHFHPAAGLRPTTDRVRETLFNWLAPVIEGARCADLFAGSGALGLEAVSRGARRALLIEQSARACRDLRGHLDTLQTRCAEVIQADCLDWLNRGSGHGPFDIVFIDPPFGTDLATAACQAVAEAGLLAPDAWIYLETGKQQDPVPVPERWQLHREKTAGDVRYRLYRVQALF